MGVWCMDVCGESMSVGGGCGTGMSRYGVLCQHRLGKRGGAGACRFRKSP